MRYLVGFVFVLAALVAPPLSAGAQDGEESTTVEPSAEEPTPSSEPAPEEPALQLNVDDLGVDLVPIPSRTEDGFTLEEMELRLKRAKMGLLGPAALIVAGLPLLLRGRTTHCPYEGYDPERCERLRSSGIYLMAMGALGMIVGSSLVGVRKRELRWAVNEYTLQEKQKRRSKRRKIALGVTIPILGAAVGLAIGGAVAMSNAWD